MLPQAATEGFTALDGLAPVDGQATFVETDVRVAPSAVRVVLHRSRVYHRRRRLVPARLHERGHWTGIGGPVRLEEAAVVSAHECVAASAVVEVVHAERIGVYRGACDAVRVVALKDVGLRHAINCWRLEHFICI